MINDNPVMVLALAGIASTGIILADMSADITDTDIICSDESSVSTLMERSDTCFYTVSPLHPLFIVFKYIFPNALVLLVKYKSKMKLKF